MLRRMSLTNFKCWREFDVDLAPITIFFGTNSSGKTAILQSLLMLKQTVHGYDIDTHLNLGTSRRDYVALGNYRDIIFNHEVERQLAVSIQWLLDRKGIEELKSAWWEDADQLHDGAYPEYQIGFRSNWALNGTVSTKRNAYDLIENGRLLHRFESQQWTEKQYKLTHLDLDGESSLAQPRIRYETEFERLENGYMNAGSAPVILRNSNIMTDARFVAFQLSHVMHRLRYIGPLRDIPRRIYEWADSAPATVQPDGANAVQMLIASAREDNDLVIQVEHGLQLLGLVHKFSVVPIDKEQQVHRVVVDYCESSSALVDVGFGVSQVLPVVTLLLSAPEGSIILLEQPELHLHPNAQAALADLMLHAAETRGLQLIVESHSEHILRRLQRRIAEADAEFATPENVKMYFCRPSENGSTAEEIAIDRFGQISNWPEKFMGDVSGDLHTMLKAALKRRSKELERDGTRA